MLEVKNGINGLGVSRLELIIILTSLAVFAPLSTDMYLPSFPQIQEYFNTEGGNVQLSLSSFFAAFALGQLIFGPLSDRYGRRKPLYLSLVIFIASSLACTVAPNIAVLIVLRFFQGLGACAGAVISMAVIRDVFEGGEAAKAFSLMAVVGGLVPMSAPTLGGFVLKFSGWKTIFIILALVGFICLILMHFRLPETVPDKRLSVAPRKVATAYWRIFKDKSFILFTIGMGLGGAGMFAYIAGAPFVFMDGFGLSPQIFGIVFGSNVVGLMFSAQVNVMLLKKFNPLQVLKLGVTIQFFAGILFFLTAYFRIGGLAGVLIPLFLYLFCLGFVRPNATVLMMAPFKSCAGTASALMGALQFVLASLAAMVMGLLHSSAAWPMALVICVCGISGYLVSVKALKSAKDFDMNSVKAGESQLEPPPIED